MGFSSEWFHFLIEAGGKMGGGCAGGSQWPRSTGEGKDQENRAGQRERPRSGGSAWTSPGPTGSGKPDATSPLLGRFLDQEAAI